MEVFENILGTFLGLTLSDCLLVVLGVGLKIDHFQCSVGTDNLTYRQEVGGPEEAGYIQDTGYRNRRMQDTYRIQGIWICRNSGLQSSSYAPQPDGPSVRGRRLVSHSNN